MRNITKSGSLESDGVGKDGFRGRWCDKNPILFFFNFRRDMPVCVLCFHVKHLTWYILRRISLHVHVHVHPLVDSE